MALSYETLSEELQTELSDALNIVDEDQMILVCDAIAKAIVTEITSNAEVSGSSLTGGPIEGTVS